MLFDDPSSSSPANGDARLTDAAAAGSYRHPPPDPVRGLPTSSAPRFERTRESELPSREPRLVETAGAPAPEALQGTAIAAAVVRDLYDSGREVRFAFVPSRERVTVLLCDMDGVVLSRLTPARALEIATGEAVPGGRRR